MDERRSAEIVAKRRNNAAARKLPLFAAAGILDQVVPTVTPEQVLERRHRCRANAIVIEAESRIQHRADLLRYQAAYAELGGDVAEAAARCAKACVPYALRFNPNPPAEFEITASDLVYQLDWWNREIGRISGLTSTEVFTRYRKEPASDG